MATTLAAALALLADNTTGDINEADMREAITFVAKFLNDGLGTDLSFGTIADGEFLKRVGSSIVSAGVGAGVEAFGELYVTGSTGTQSVSLTPTFSKVTLWDSNGESSGTTPDHTTDDITITTAGKYLILLSMSVRAVLPGKGFTGFQFAAFKNGAQVARQISQTTAIVTLSMIQNLVASDVLDVRVTALGLAATLEVNEANLSIVRVGT